MFIWTSPTKRPSIGEGDHHLLSSTIKLAASIYWPRIKEETLPKEKGIILDKERGVNPHMTVCPRCGKDGPEIMLLGNSDYLHECSSCGASIVHRKVCSRCPKCSSRDVKRIRRIGENERISGSLCDECSAKDKECEAAVKEGGVFWRCKDCGSAGALRKDSELAKKVRESAGIKPPDLVGIEFSKEEGCPVCGPNAVAPNDH